MKLELLIYRVLVAVAALSLSVLAVKVTHLSKQGQEAHAAICTYRSSLERQNASSQKFLLAHPHGIPGIPASLIRNSIADQQKTINALSTVHC